MCRGWTDIYKQNTSVTYQNVVKQERYRSPIIKVFIDSFKKKITSKKSLNMIIFLRQSKKTRNENAISDDLCKTLPNIL